MSASFDTANFSQNSFNAAVSNAVTLASVTVGGSDNVIMVYAMSVPTNPGTVPSSVTWNGSSMTLLGSQIDAAQVYVASVWYILNPTPGTGSVVVTTSSGMTYAYVAAVPALGVNATSSATAFGTLSWTYNSSSPVTTVSATGAGAGSSDIYSTWGYLNTSTITDMNGNMTRIGSFTQANDSFSLGYIPGSDPGLASYSGTGGTQNSGIALSFFLSGHSNASPIAWVT